MDIQSIIAEIEAERDRLDEAIAALQGVRDAQGKIRSARNGRKGRHLSAAARKRISKGMKRRWAARKKAAA